MPTVILFKEGKEYDRRPLVGDKGRLIKFTFNAVSPALSSLMPYALCPQDNVVAAFDLNNLFEECKSHPLKKTAAASATRAKLD